MAERLAPSSLKHSDDPAEQAYATHAEYRARKLGAALRNHVGGGRVANLASLQDFVWEQALDFVAPLEPVVRDELRRAKTGLPWMDRLDVGLYWRLMYAAHVEGQVDAGDGDGRRAWNRPLKHVVAAAAMLTGQLAMQDIVAKPDFLTALFAPGATRIGSLLYQGIVDRAADQIRVRRQMARAPEPLAPHARVRVSGAMAEVAGFDVDGSVVVSRETEPADRGSLDWRLDPRHGRWRAVAWPGDLEALP